MLFRRDSSQDVSLGDNVDALRMEGRVAGQLDSSGVYPSGALGKARLCSSATAPVISASDTFSRGKNKEPILIQHGPSSPIPGLFTVD